MILYHILRFFILPVFLISTYNSYAHKIIYFVSPPRSLSVAFLRMIQARGDFSIMHEPSQYYFNKINSPGLVQSWYKSESFQSFDEVKNAIVTASKEQNIFVKEISFAVHDIHCNDFELMKNPDVYFVFLIRNPHHTTISMYKKIANVFDTVAHQMPYLVGYKALYNIFMAAQHHAINQPYIMRTEDIYTNPEETIKKFCNHVGIEFKPESLHWENLSDTFDGQEAWHELKYKELTHHWHGDAIKSTGFGKPTTYEVDAQGIPTFSEITNPNHRALCKKVCEEHVPYYNLLIKEWKLLLNLQRSN